MGRRYFTDDPLLLQRVVQPGRMPIGMEGILLSICLIGAFFGNLFFGALGDNFGRKAMLEVALSIMIIGSFFSAFSFSGIQATATGNNVVGSLCFWRVILGFGVGGIFPLTATIMAEYSSKYTRGGYVSLGKQPSQNQYVFKPIDIYISISSMTLIVHIDIIDI